jgi:hypothetical protein
MKLYFQSGLCLCLALALCACDELSQKQDQPPQVKKPESAPEAFPDNGRFVPIAPTSGGAMPMIMPWHGFFALDTRTGMLCRTVDRQFPKTDWASELPLCTPPASNGSSARKLTPEQEKMLDEAFGPPKTAEEFIKKHGGETKTKPTQSNK